VVTYTTHFNIIDIITIPSIMQQLISFNLQSQHGSVHRGKASRKVQNEKKKSSAQTLTTPITRGT
jgi:hypothetical protein